MIKMRMMMMMMMMPENWTHWSDDGETRALYSAISNCFHNHSQH